MSTSLRLVSPNVERSKHLDRIIPFLERIKPDVVCMQELMEPDVPTIAKALGAVSSLYAPMALHDMNGAEAPMGVGIFSKIPFELSEIKQYAGYSGPLLWHDTTDAESRYNSTAWILALGKIRKDDKLFTIGTTHFVWAAEGGTNELQKSAIKDLMELLDAEKEFVFCGDLNAPRGGEIFSLLASRYKDNVPEHYTASIDGSLHKAGALPYMVDGLFSTPGYSVTDFEMVEGVSDHKALVATVSKQ